MNVEREVLLMPDETLSLNGRSSAFTRMGVPVKDREIGSSTFATVGSLIEFVLANQPSGVKL